MPVRKISLTIEESTLSRARAVAGPGGLSGFVDQAVAERLDRDERRRALLELLDDLDRADPPTDAQVEAGRRRSAEILDATR